MLQQLSKVEVLGSDVGIAVEVQRKDGWEYRGKLNWLRFKKRGKSQGICRNKTNKEAKMLSWLLSSQL